MFNFLLFQCFPIAVQGILSHRFPSSHMLVSVAILVLYDFV